MNQLVRSEVKEQLHMLRVKHYFPYVSTDSGK